MRNKILSIALALVMAAGVCPLAAITTSADDDEIVEITTAGTCNYDYANEVAELVNEEREAAGLNTLVNDKRLTEWAMQRAAEQAFYFGHVRPDGTGPGTVSEEGIFGYPYYQTFAENAAGDYKTPTAVMDGWMNSAGHKATLMRDDFTAVGVGCFTTGAGYTYWIQIFAGPSKGAGGDYEIIESTYSGTKEQTFTISIYASYLEDLTIDCSPPAYNGTTTTVVGCTATAKLIASNSAPSYSYLRGVIDPIVSDVKDENTGEVIATTSVGSGGVVTITATAAGTGYLYLYAYEGATPKSVEIIVSAGYTVTFDSCGGSAVASQTVTYGSNATEPETPTRSGYTFEGWYVSDIADEAYSFSVAVPKDLTLYARWTANTTSTSTTTKDSDSETSSEPIETTTKSEETTTASTEPDETTAEPDEETTAPDEETTAQDYDSETTAEPTEPDEETTGEAAETTSTEDMTETTETQTENTSEKSDTDSAAVANNGNGGDDGDTGSDEENGSNTWIVVLVAVLLVAAAGATAFIVLRRNKSVENVNLAESTETENDNDNEEGEIDGNTGGDDE